MPKIGSLFRNGAFENAETPQSQLPQEKAFVYSTSSLEPQMILLPHCPQIGSIPFIRFLIRYWNLLDSLFSWLHLLTHIELIWIHEFNIHVYNHLDPLKSFIASH